MASELQSLLDKIQTEGVAKANAEAERIIADAKAKAVVIVADAEAKAAIAKKQSEADAALFQQRAEQAVKQAARDVLLSVKVDLDQTLQRIFLTKISEALTPDFLRGLITDVVRAYAASPEAAHGMDIALASGQVKELEAMVLKEARQIAATEIRIAPNADVRAGFRVTLANGRIEHDFTAQAIQTALAKFLRPALAKIIES